MTSMGAAVVGVDAGGTKTDVLVVDRSGTVLAHRGGPGCNHEAIGWEVAQTRLHAVVREALDACGVHPDDVAASGWGMSGLDWPDDAARYERMIARLGLAGDRLVVNDAFLALEATSATSVTSAASAAAAGIAVVSGTGVVVVGRTPQGRTARTLGVGAGRGDWGSGGDVVRAAVEAVAEEHMGVGPPTALTAAALRCSGASSVDEFCEAVWRRSQTHLLPPDVWDVAASGDEVAQAIADRVADSLAAGAGSVATRLGLDKCRVVLAGRVLDPGHPALHDRVVAALTLVLPGSKPERMGCPPVVAAATAAGRLAGWAGAAGWHPEAYVVRQPAARPSGPR